MFSQHSDKPVFTSSFVHSCGELPGVSPHCPECQFVRGNFFLELLALFWAVRSLLPHPVQLLYPCWMDQCIGLGVSVWTIPSCGFPPPPGHYCCWFLAHPVVAGCSISFVGETAVLTDCMASSQYSQGVVYSFLPVALSSVDSRMTLCPTLPLGQQVKDAAIWTPIQTLPRTYLFARRESLCCRHQC